jgi:enoyl-CoA hydratase/carnithine racemase
MYKHIELEIEGAVGFIRFSREASYNAMCNDMMLELVDALASLEQRNLHVLLITGKGKAFMSGADIKEYAGFMLADFEKFQRESARIYALIESFPFPVIAAINGYAVGGGFEIALAADIRIAKSTAKMGLPEAKLGLIPGGGGTQRLMQLTNLGFAKEILLLGRLYSAADMFRMGLVTAVVEVEDWDSALSELIGELIKIPAQSHAALKQLLHSDKQHQLMQHRLKLEGELVAHLFQTEQAQYLIQSFANK